MGAQKVAHSLLATGATLDRVSQEMHRSEVTYRHGAHVNVVPAMF